jgi:hypothetical protein
MTDMHGFKHAWDGPAIYKYACGQSPSWSTLPKLYLCQCTPDYSLCLYPVPVSVISGHDGSTAAVCVCAVHCKTLHLGVKAPQPVPGGQPTFWRGEKVVFNTMPRLLPLNKGVTMPFGVSRCSAVHLIHEGSVYMCDYVHNDLLPLLGVRCQL